MYYPKNEDCQAGGNMKASTVDIVRNNATLKQWVNDSNLSEHQKLVINEAIGKLTHNEIKLKGLEREKKYLVFKEDTSVQGKTKLIDVLNIYGENLGFIKWYGPYRGYAYHAGGIFDAGCLFEAISKINEMNDEHRKKKL